MRRVVDGDSIGGNSKVVDAAIWERDAFVESESSVAVRIDVIRGSILHKNDDVLQFCCDPRRQLIERGLHNLLEHPNIHAVIVPGTRVRPT